MAFHLTGFRARHGTSSEGGTVTCAEATAHGPIWQQKPAYRAKEAYYTAKRPNYRAKET